MVPENVSPEKILEMDIVIIGGGGSGLAAAISAVEAGANPHRVLVLEKRVPGGNSTFTEGIFAVDSPVQERLGIIPESVK